jgi:hypothetical protein
MVTTRERRSTGIALIVLEAEIACEFGGALSDPSSLRLLRSETCEPLREQRPTDHTFRNSLGLGFGSTGKGMFCGWPTFMTACSARIGVSGSIQKHATNRRVGSSSYIGKRPERIVTRALS